jgi:hypothetical protein
MSNLIRVRFQENLDNWYEAVVGSVFTDEFSETLDSGTVVLAHVPPANRLVNLHPYSYAQVEINGELRLYLVDSFNEKIENVSTLYYTYTVQLMSETKILEKWQLPNRAVTHSLISSQKTIAQVIKELYTLYVPKVKTSTDGKTWSYQPFLSYDTTIDSKFSVSCKDITVSQPTLRQALTVLMSQIGCLPRVYNHTLTFLDLRATPAETWSAETDSRVNYVDRSMASDSYVTSLVNMGENFLDTSNEVRNEVVGFRDRSTVGLSKTQNLFINTQMPIYKVNKLDLVAFLKGNITLVNKRPSDSNYQGTTITVSQQAGLVHLVFSFAANPTADTIFSNITCYLVAPGNGIPHTIIGSATVPNFTVSRTATGDAPSYETNVALSSFTMVTGYTYSQAVDAEIAFTELSDTGTNSRCIYVSWLGAGDTPTTYSNVIYPFSEDITPICVERSKRQQLITDYTQIPSSVSSVSQLGQYYYSTVQYQVGGTTIEGFSSAYSLPVAWWSDTYTVFENIVNGICSVIKSESPTDYALAYMGAYLKGYYGLPDETTFGVTASGVSTYTYLINIIDDFEQLARTTYGFSSFVFSIYYQPLNSFGISFSHKGREEDVPIEQLDTSQSGVTSLDDFSLAEQDKANRLGNDIVSINQCFGTLHSVNSIFTGSDGESYTVFRRVISYENSFIQVNYFGSKDYVIRNYSVAIQTKYRAYQYVDYNQAVIRKERKKVYALLSGSYFYGDDLLTFSDGDTAYPYTGGKYLLAAADGSGASWSPLQYAYETGNLTDGTSHTMKNELSVSNFGSSIVLSYQQFDNVSPGLRVLPNEYRTDLLGNGIGGLPQEWYIWNETAWQSHGFGFCGGVDYFSTDKSSSTYLSYIYNEPDITSIFSTADPTLSMHDKGSSVLTYYKDNAEIINQTLQIEYYTDLSYLSWTSMFARLCPYGGDTSGYTWYATEDTNYLTLSEEPFSMAPETYAGAEDYIEAVPSDGYLPPYLLVKKSGPFMVYVYDGTQYYDVMLLTNVKAGAKIYLTMNDTKTKHVWQTTGGLPNTTATVALNDTGRSLS